MSQAPSQGQFAAGAHSKRGAPMDVYTGLLLAALIVLLAGFITILAANMDLSDGETGSGGMMDSIPGFKVVA